MNDQARLVAGGGIRAVATGMMGISLGVYLAKLGFSADQIGAIVSAGLGGQVAATVAVTLGGHHFGRRRALVVTALLGFLGSIAATLTSNVAWLALAAGVGMLNGMGRDRGAASVIEQAAIPATATDTGRTRAFAVYHLVQDAGAFAGSLLAALPSLLLMTGLVEISAWKAALVLHGAMLLAAGALYAGLSEGVEGSAPPRALEPRSRRVLARICGLFFIDALGGGFLTASLMSYFFFERFGVGAGAIALLFGAARVANALSHLGAAWLARRIGLVNTMVFTHIPSSVLLVTVAFAPSFPVAAVLFLLREGLVEMDVPTRTSYVMAMVRPEERTFAAGVTNLVRVVGWAVAPAFAGLLMARFSLVVPLVVAAILKVTYDVALWIAFRHLPPPEEQRA